MTEIEEKILNFKADMSKTSSVDLLHKHILFAEPHVIARNQYIELRSEVSKKFNIHPTEIFMVGSGKLGFSIAPDKQYRAFNDNSDIDIAIVSEKLFLRYWQAAYSYQQKHAIGWETRRDFKNYLFRGWIRPDKFPNIPEADEWWEFFRELTRSGKYGKYKISAGLYKNWFFIEQYFDESIVKLEK